MQRVGVFSGTFDPIHMGHIEACLVAKSVLRLNNILIFIEKKPRQKTNVTPYKHRFEMLDQSIRMYPSMRLVDTGEDNVSTSRCLELLEKMYPDYEYWYIVGSDMLEQMVGWPDADNLFKHFNLCIVLRDNQDKPNIQKQTVRMQAKFLGLKCEILPAVWSGVSSSSVKADIKHIGTSNAIPMQALTYIKKHKLYN